MPGKDSDPKSQIPSSPQSSATPPRPNAPTGANPIILGLFGGVLVCSGAAGARYLYTHPTSQATPQTASEPERPTAVADPEPVDRARKNPAPPVSLVAANSRADNPQTPAAKPIPSEAKKTPPAASVKSKAGVKTTAAAILPQTSSPVQSPAPVPQPPPETQSSAPVPLPPVVKIEDRKQPAAEQPVLPATVKVSEGLPVRIVLAEDVPGDAKEGMTLRFVAAASVMVDGKIVIAQGAPVTGTVAGRKKKILGMGSGKVTYQLNNLQAVDGNHIKVRATIGHNDGTPTNQFEPPKDSAKKGFAAVQGAEYVAYIDTEQTVSVRK